MDNIKYYGGWIKPTKEFGELASVGLISDYTSGKKIYEKTNKSEERKPMFLNDFIKNFKSHGLADTQDS